MAVKAGRDESVVESLDASLAVLQPETNSIEIDGEIITIKPYTFSQLLKALRHLANIADVFDDKFNENVELGLLRGLAEHGDDVLALICLATGKDIEFFDNIPSDKGLDLAVMTYKVNESFFVKNLLPKLQELFPQAQETQTENEPPEEALKSKSKKAGSISSKS